MDKEKIADDLQVHSSSLTAIVEALGQVTALLKKRRRPTTKLFY